VREKLNFNTLWEQIRHELKLVGTSPRGLIVMFESYMMSVINEILAMRFGSEWFEKMNENQRLQIVKEFHLVSPNLLKNIEAVRKVRNEIAHKPMIHTPEVIASIKEKISQIPKIEKINEKAFLNDFINVCYEILNSLHMYYDHERDIYEANFDENENIEKMRIEFIKHNQGYREKRV